MPITVSVSDIQRNYRSIIDKINKTKEPVVLMRRNKAVGVVVDLITFEKMRIAKSRWEEEDTRKAIAVAEKELKAGKLKLLKGSLGDLMAKIDED